MSETIQLVLAPAFLLVAIGSLLAVVTNRLGRIIDRARQLEDRISVGEGEREFHLMELKSLDRRMRLSHWSINFLSLAALLVAILVATLFLGRLGEDEYASATSLLFISAMIGVMLGIALYILEVYIATRTVRVRFDRL